MPPMASRPELAFHANGIRVKVANVLAILKIENLSLEALESLADEARALRSEARALSRLAGKAFDQALKEGG